MTTGPGSALRRPLGSRQVGSIALGGAQWAFSAELDENAIRDVIAAALASGIDLFDTAAAYSRQPDDRFSERVLGAVLEELAPGAVRDGAITVSTKGGHTRGSDGTFPIDGTREALRRDLEGSLIALQLERIPLYFLHHPDPEVRIEDSVAALAEMQDEGLIDFIGLSNVSVGQARRAGAVARIDAVQNKLSVVDQRDWDVASYCAQNDIAYLAYSPLGGAGTLAKSAQAPELQRIAEARMTSIQQVALSWLLTLTPQIIPVVGARSAKTIRSSASASSAELTSDDRRALRTIYD